jgi:hypothetical protein
LGSIFPKIGFGGKEFDFRQAGLFLFQIKDDLEVASGVGTGSAGDFSGQQG